MIPARIVGTAHLLPGREVSTAELVERTRPGADPSRLVAATGVSSRRWADPGTTVTEVGARVLRDALDAAGLPATALDRVVFTSSTGGDWIIPATACAILGELGLDGRADGFDLMNACVGLLSGLDLAARSIATGMGHVAVVAVELNSRLLAPERPRPYTLFGDAASAVVLGPARRGEGFRAIHLASAFAGGPTIAMPHPGAVGGFELPDFHTPSDRMTTMAVEGVVTSVRRVLAEAGLGLREVPWFLPHQPNGPLLRAILDALEIPPARVDVVVGETGSTAAASVGITLDRLFRSGKVRPGDHVLAASVGSPLVHGAVLYRSA